MILLIIKIRGIKVTLNPGYQIALNTLTQTNPVVLATGTAFYGLLVFILIPVGIYLAYFIQTTRTLEQINNRSRFQSFDAIKRFNLTVNLRKQTIDLVYRLDKLATNNLTFSEFKNQLDNENFGAFDNWLNEVMRRKDAAKNLVIYFKPSRTYRGFYARLTVLKVEKTSGLIYLSGLRSAKESIKILKGVKILGALAFKDKVLELNPNKGALIILNFNLLDVINRRYDKEIATSYIKALWSSVVNKIIEPQAIVGIYRGDSIVIFNPILTSKRETIAFIETQIKKLGNIISFDSYTFDTKPIAGFTLFNEFTKGIDLLIKQAFKAAEYARLNGLSISDYDTEVEPFDASNIKQANEIKRMIEQQYINPNYVPVISLINGKNFGVIAKVNFAFTEIKNFNAAFQIAKENDLEKEFVELVLSQWFKAFIKIESQYKKLIIFIDTKQLDIVDKILSAQPRYRKLPIVIVITDYDNIIKNKTSLFEFEQLKKFGLKFGVVAQNSMQTIIHPVLNDFEYLVWPSKLIKDILKDEKSQLALDNIIESTSPFSLRSVAWEIKSYEQAEFLKNKGVNLMSGPLFMSDITADNTGYSARKVQKLIG
jgi:EAL domain-containing protein (putative c-di-GMP-specific phosphodiesterase class I)